jgi:predicted ATPase/DNA-binding SARP family transcriptional activator
MAILQIQLLSDFQIRYADTPLDGFDAPRLQSLLAYLVLHRDEPQPRKQLAFLLWQDSSEHQAHGNLRNLVHRLKKALPEADHFLFADTQTLQWRADAPFTLDVDEFQRAAAQSKSSSALQDAVSLYRGDLLPACYDEWLLPERERLREKLMDCLAQLIVFAEAARDYHAAIGYARRLVQADPLGEEAYRKLMSLYAQIGDRANVVRVYQTCATVLKRELDTEPSATTRELFERLHREEIVVERTPVPRGKAKPNLPVPLTSFVGRTRELGEIRAKLERARLVTLTGVGGGGKTRLAIQAAHQRAADFADGAWFVELAPLADAADLPSTCAAVFGLREQAGLSIQEMLSEYLREKELLLVLDNCEHLLTACAKLAQTILQGAPRVRMLATSRESLNLSGEALIVVPPLSLPDAKHVTFENMADSDAAQLFITRASFNLPTFTLNQSNLEAVAQICRRLDGIPLAIELAAARVRALSPEQIAARLDDALAVLTRGSSGMPARHQTMRAVLDWSDALLTEQERVLFWRLSVFAGGFTLDAAEQVSGDREQERMRDREPTPRHPLMPSSLILDLLSNLIDKSLVYVLEVESNEEARYGLLEPIRQYAREKLESVGEQETVCARHLAWCVELGARMQAELEGARQAAGLAYLEREHDNLRGALEFALHSEHRELGLRLATALERFWMMGGHSIEGRSWLKQLLGSESPGDTLEPAAARIDPAIRARALGVASALAWRHNDFAEADAFNQKVLGMWTELKNQAGIAQVLRQMGEVARMRGEYALAVELHQQSLSLSRELADKRGIATALSNLGATWSEQGDYARASEFYQEGVELVQAFGDVWLIALFKNNLGVALRIQDPQRAERLHRESLTLRQSLNDHYGVAISLRNLAELALAREDWMRARTLFMESMSIHQRTHNEKWVADCLVGLAWVEHAQGRNERAARLLGISERLRETIHAVLPEDDRAEYEDLRSRVRAQLDERTWREAWANGRTYKFEQAVAYALDEST